MQTYKLEQFSRSGTAMSTKNDWHREDSCFHCCHHQTQLHMAPGTQKERCPGTSMLPTRTVQALLSEGNEHPAGNCRQWAQ